MKPWPFNTSTAALIIVAGTLAASASMSSAAQAPARQPATQPIEEVIVTARRTEERLQDVPVAVTVLDSAELERRGTTSVMNLTTAVPALHVGTFNSSDTLVVGIRGQRNQQVQPGQDPSIGYYFADVPTGFQVGLNTGLFDLQDIQVLKGPQGTLFGRNSTGGAVLVDPVRPTNALEGYVKAGASFFEEGEGYTTQAVANLPFGDRLALRVGLDTVDRDGYVRNIADPELNRTEVFPTPDGPSDLEPLGDQNSRAWRVGLLAKPTGAIENFLLYQGVHYRSNGLSATLTGINPAYPLKTQIPDIATLLPPILAETQAAQRDYFWTAQSGSQLSAKVDQHTLYNTTTWNLGAVTLKNIAGGKWLDSSRFTNYSGTPYQLLLSAVDPQNGREFSEEFQVQGTSFGDALSWTGGLFYFHNYYHSSQNPTIQLALPSLRVPVSAVNPVTRTGIARGTTWAAYAQGTYRLPWVTGLSATLGLRYTHDERELRVQQFSNATTCALRDASGNRLPFDACEFEGDKSFSVPTYTATLDYKPNPATLLYLSHARGYRAGGFNVASTTPAEFAPFDPEIVLNYEAGVKKDWHFGGVPVRTNAAVYHQDYRDIQRVATDPNNVAASRLFNVTSANVDGAELEVKARPLQGLELGGSYAYVRARYAEPFVVSGPGGVRQDISDNEFSFVPKTTWSLNAAYSLPLASEYGRVVVSGDYYHESRTWFDDTAQGPLYGTRDQQSSPPHGLLDLRVDWNSAMGSNVDVALWASNVTNEGYYSSGVPVYPSLGIWAAYVNQPRFVGIEFKYRFGRRAAEDHTRP